MIFNNKIYDKIKSGNFDEDQGEIREKSGNFISHSEWEPWPIDIYPFPFEDWFLGCIIGAIRDPEEWTMGRYGVGKLSPHVATEAKSLQCKYLKLIIQSTYKFEFVATGFLSPVHPFYKHSLIFLKKHNKIYQLSVSLGQYLKRWARLEHCSKINMLRSKVIFIDYLKILWTYTSNIFSNKCA